MSPSRIFCPRSVVSRVAVRFMFLIGDTQRSISSTATGIFAGSRSSRSRCSGWRISASMPSVITWRVVSSPPTRISRLSCTRASSSSFCESISACTSTLIRSSSGGFARRSAITSQRVLRVLEPGLHRARRQLRRRRRRGRRQHLLGPAQQAVAVLGRHAEQVADHDHRQRRGDLAHEVAAPLLADRVDQLRHDPPDLRLVILDAALGEALVDERAAQLVLRVVHVDHRRQRRGIRARAHARAEQIRRSSRPSSRPRGARSPTAGSTRPSRRARARASSGSARRGSPT